MTLGELSLLRKQQHVLAPYSSLVLKSEGDDLSNTDLLWSSHGALSTSLSSSGDSCPRDFRGQVWPLAGS